MALPEPVPGLNVRYSYLWRREQPGRSRRGPERTGPARSPPRSGPKTVSALVLVLPVTHSEPQANARIALPSPVKRRLGWTTYALDRHLGVQRVPLARPRPSARAGRRRKHGRLRDVAAGLFEVVRQTLLTAISARRTGGGSPHGIARNFGRRMRTWAADWCSCARTHPYSQIAELAEETAVVVPAQRFAIRLVGERSRWGAQRRLPCSRRYSSPLLKTSRTLSLTTKR